MRLKIFLALTLVLIITSAVLLGYQTREALLMVNVGLNLRIFRDSSHIPGHGSISKANTNVTLIEWPQIANEIVNWNLKYDYYATRSTPVQFFISLRLGTEEKVLTISNLIKTGEYTGSLSSPFSVVKQGIYSLTITIWVANYSDIKDQLNRSVIVP